LSGRHQPLRAGLLVSEQVLAQDRLLAIGVRLLTRTKDTDIAGGGLTVSAKGADVPPTAYREA
jgi:hypothetical protein